MGAANIFHNFCEIFHHFILLPTCMVTFLFHSAACSLPDWLRGDNDTIVPMGLISTCVVIDAIQRFRSKGSIDGYQQNRIKNVAGNVGMLYFAFCQFTSTDHRVVCKSQSFTLLVEAILSSNSQWVVIIAIYSWSLLVECCLWYGEWHISLLLTDSVQLILNVTIGILANCSLHPAFTWLIVAIFFKILNEALELVELYRDVDFRWSPRFHAGAGEEELEKHILCIGNPGRGKSTILNGIAECEASFASVCCGSARVVFHSGFNLGTGMTTHMHKVKLAKCGINLVDTPGLNDVAAQQVAAREIQAAMTQEGLFKIIFVITLMNGRTDPQDIILMEWVLRQAQQIHEYGIIINQASPTVMALHKNDPGALEKALHLDTMKLQERRPRATIVAMAEVGWLKEVKDAAPILPKTVKHFIDNLPEVLINKDRVKIMEFQESVKYLSDRLQEVEAELKLTQHVSDRLLNQYRLLYSQFRRFTPYRQVGRSVQGGASVQGKKDCVLQ